MEFAALVFGVEAARRDSQSALPDAKVRSGPSRGGRVRVDLRGLPRRAWGVGIVARTTAGRRVIAARRLRTCTPGRPSTVGHFIGSPGAWEVR